MKNVNAISMLKEQHREVADLFEEFEEAKDDAEAKERLFTEIADKLVVHATIEERHFYPAVKAKRTEDILLESLEEHLSIKRVLADLLDLDATDATFAAKVKVLQEQVEHHVEEEEEELFPKVKKALDEDELIALAQEMAATQEELVAEGNPREAVSSETEKAAPL